MAKLLIALVTAVLCAFASTNGQADDLPVYPKCVYSPSQFGNLYLTAMVIKQGTLGAINDEELSKVYQNGPVELRKHYYEDVSIDPKHRFRAAAAPIGRLDLLQRRAEGYCIEVCTGWLATDELVVTSGHCTGYPDATLVQVKFVLNYQIGSTPEVIEVVPKPLQYSTSNNEDFAVFRAQQPVGKKYGKLDIYKGQIRPSHSLVVIGHPFALAKQMMRANCYSTPLYPIDGSFLKHTCNTFPSMSGSPVMDEETGTVLAIHQGGIRANEWNPNNAILISKLLASRPELSNLLTGSNGSGEVVQTAAANINIPLTQARNDEQVISKIVYPLTFSIAPGVPVDDQKIDELLQSANKILEDNKCPLVYAKSERASELPANEPLEVVITHALSEVDFRP